MSTSFSDTSYGRCFISGPPERPEPAVRPDPRMSEAEVLRTFGFSRDDFQRAKAFGFPASLVHPSQAGLFKREKVFEWRDRIKALAARL